MPYPASLTNWCGCIGYGSMFEQDEDACRLCARDGLCKELTNTSSVIESITDSSLLPQYLTSSHETIRLLAEEKFEELRNLTGR